MDDMRFHLRTPASVEDTVLKVQEFAHLYVGDELTYPPSGERVKVLETPAAPEVKVARSWMGTEAAEIDTSAGRCLVLSERRPGEVW